MKTIGSFVKVSCGAVCSVLMAFAAIGADRTWNGSAGDGIWSTAANWSDNAIPVGGDVAIFNNTGAVGGVITVSVTDTRTVQQIRNNGTADVVINIAVDQRLNVSNSGSAGIQAFNGDITINGPGNLGLSTGESTATGLNHLDSGADPGRTLTITAQITDVNGGNNTGFETWRGTPPGGTVVLTNPNNAFTMAFQAGSGHLVITPTLANMGQPCAIGAGPNIVPNRCSILRYTGPAVSTDRRFLLNGGNVNEGGIGGGLEQAGSGILTWAGPIYNNNNAVQTLILRGEASSPEARITGDIYNNQGSLAILKEGSGTWELSGNNTFTGGLFVNAGTLALASVNAGGNVAQITVADGATLVLASAISGNVAQITVADGAILSVNPSQTPNFSATFPVVLSANNATIHIAEASSGSSSVTFRGLTAANVSINAPNAGTLANRIFVDGLPASPVGAWLTLNGGPAKYDLINGLTPVSITLKDGIQTRDDSLPNGDTIKAVIDTAVFVGDPIELLFNPTSLFSLTMAATGDPAKIDTAGKTLMVGEVAIAAGADALTIGVAPEDGLLLPLGLDLGDPIPTEGDILALGPIIWYDPSDIATVTLNATGHVTNLLNKATTGAMFDAIVRPNANPAHTPPLYATGTASYALRPMLWNTVANQGLQSAALTGISTNNNRTLVSVQARTGEAIVSIGEGVNYKAFENYLTGANIRFGGYASDLDITPAAPVRTPIVMVFISGVDGNDNAYQGWADGVPTSTIFTNDNFDTTDTPLHLGHRNGTGTYTGQIGEVLLFDRTLNDTERKTLEAYLAAKWKNPESLAAAPQQIALMTLRNDSTETFTVNAAVNAPLDSVVSLTKTGPGDVTLAGGVRLSGTLVLSEGLLILDTPDGLIDLLYGSTAGPGKLVKDGPGLLFLPGTVASQHTGGVDILNGAMRISSSRSLGSGDVTIFDGGTLDISGGSVGGSITNANRIYVSGAGHDGKGAIVNNGPVEQRYAFQNTTIQLTGDTAIGGSTTPRWDIFGTSGAAAAFLDLNGFTLTKLGVTDFRISPATVINAPEGVAFDIKAGTLGIESGTILSPNDAKREIHIAGGGARFGVYNTSVHQNWKIVPADGAEIWAYGGNESTNQNVLTSDMFLPGTLHLTASGTYNKVFTGQFTGPGGLYVRTGGNRTMSLLSYPNNTFTGTVLVNNAILGLRCPGSLPDRSKLTQEGTGYVRVFMGGADEWTSADVDALVTEPHLFTASDRRFQIQVIAGNTGVLTHDIGSASNPFRTDFDINGGGTLVIDSDVTLGQNARVNNGTLILTNNAVWDGRTGLMYMQDYALNDGTPSLSKLIVCENAKFIFTDPGYNNAPNARAIRLPQNNGRGVIELKDNAFIQSNLIQGGFEAPTDTHAAIYQSGNSEWMSFGGGGNDGRFGRYGYGYYQLDGGKLTMKGWTSLGGVNNATSVGILRQTGGLIEFTGKRSAVASPAGTVGDSYDGCFGISRGGRGLLQLEGGEFRHWGELRVLDEADNSNNNGTAVMTVAGTADVTIDRQVQIGNRNSTSGNDAFAILNLNGGKLTTTYIQRMNRNAYTAINFNGGTLCVTNNSGNNALFALENTATDQLGLYVHSGGATIEIGENVTRSINFPLEQPKSSGIGSIAVSTVGAGYIAPPFVTITGGGGSGATALAHINRETGQLTHIEITNPGSGYTSVPTVTLLGGGGGAAGTTRATTGTVRLAPHGTGGLTKTGAGTLVLNAANTYPGPTRVDGGTLVLRHPQAIFPGSEIIIGDGTLDLGGHTVTTPSVTITGSGGIINGKVITTSAVKTGSGVASWDAEIEFAPVKTARIPGLWEGRGRGPGGGNPGYWDLYVPNPKTSVQLTTRAGNIPSPSRVNGSGDILSCGNSVSYYWGGGQNMWIYTGYLWNRSDTNETWTFRTIFDDNVSLVIDGIQFRNQGNAAAYTTHTLTPGPHPIEIRFGDNSGNVGPGSGASGLLVDRFGRNFQSTDSALLSNYYEILADDGSGDLLTATLNEFDAVANEIRVEEGTLLLPSAAEPGLWEGRRQVPATPYWDIYFPNPKDSVQLTTRAGNFNAPNQPNTQQDRVEFWGGNYNMWMYTGYVWNRSDTNETWTWRGVFDDYVSLLIDGQLLFNQNGVTPLYANTVLTPGAHAIEIRFGDGTGSVGPYSGHGGLLVDMQGNDFQSTDSTELLEYYVRLVDPGDGSLLTLTPFGMDPDVLDGVTINVSSGATLDLGGQPRNGLTVTGEGNVINSVSGDSTILSPAGDNFTGTMSANVTSLNGMTYRVTVREQATAPVLALPDTPGLHEGMIRSAWDIVTPNPKTGVKLTTEAGNIPGPAKHNTNDGDQNIYPNMGGQPVSYYWGDNNHTWVYTGYIWNRTGTNVTWTWRFTFDDNVLLKIGDWEANIPLGLGVAYATHTLTPGPHPIEIRFGDGTGNVGPASGASGLLVDKQGRNFQSTDNNLLPDYYEILADPGDGSLLTLTANVDLPGNILNDVINFTGTVDLTGLTIMPSDLFSEEPPANKYVIATADGFTGTPTVTGFTDGKKWLTLRKGNELWLTTQGGTVLILR